jgi:hypothetical protein
MMATTWTEMMALKAVEEPILMRERRQVIEQVRMIELTGSCLVALTYEIHFEKGSPLSLAKAKVWRAVDAFQEIFAAMTMMRTIIVRAVTPWVDIAVLKT